MRARPLGCSRRPGTEKPSIRVAVVGATGNIGTAVVRAFQPTHAPITTWNVNVLGSLRVFEAAIGPI